MQIHSYQNCIIENCPIELPDSFPISYPPDQTHSPSIEQISYMHYHNNMELGLCYKGCGIFFINGKVIPFSSGDVSIIFSKQIHIAQSDKAKPSQWKFISLDPLKLLKCIPLEDFRILSSFLSKSDIAINIFSRNDFFGLNTIVNNIFCELDQRKMNYQTIIKSLVWLMISELTRVGYIQPEQSANDSHQYLMQIAPAIMFISQNYMHPINIGNLSATCNMSTSNFRRRFSKIMGVAPSEYLFIVRTEMASILLANLDASILEISSKVGYQTLSSFNRHFKRIMGCTPRDWRSNKILYK